MGTNNKTNFLFNIVAIFSLIATHTTVLIYQVIIILLIVFCRLSEQQYGDVVAPYPHVNEYYKMLPAVNVNCTHFVCKKSGLDIVKIELLLDQFNAALEIYAKSNKISNIYKLHWNNEFAILAKDKVKMCLPPTYENDKKKYIFYDNRSLPEHEYNVGKIRSMEVVIGSRTLNYSEEYSRNTLLFQADMMQYYTALFFKTAQDIKLKRSSTQVGCGYVYEEDDFSSTDHLLCLFGDLYLKDNYTQIRGNTCSNCSYQFFDSTPKWICDPKFPYLCTDANREFEEIKEEYSKFHCVLYVPYNPHDSDDTEFDEDTRPWPCPIIFVPLLVAIVIFISLCVYHLCTAYHYKLKNEP